MNLYMEAIVKDLLNELEQKNADREGLKSTPKRVSKFYKEFLTEGFPDFELTTFDAEGMDEMITQVNIPFYSLCEHHMLPFFGSACIGYIPNGKIIGLSKLARITDFFARRLQNQERLTKHIAECLTATLNPLGVGVVLKARHLCMEMRGIKARGAETTTSYLKGAIREKHDARAEFLALTRKHL